MCGPIFDVIGNNSKSKIAEQTPAAREHQAARGYVAYQPKPRPQQQIMPARARAALPQPELVLA